MKVSFNAKDVSRTRVSTWCQNGQKRSGSRTCPIPNCHVCLTSYMYI